MVYLYRRNVFLILINRNFKIDRRYSEKRIEDHAPFKLNKYSIKKDFAFPNFAWKFIFNYYYTTFSKNG